MIDHTRRGLRPVDWRMPEIAQEEERSRLSDPRLSDPRLLPVA
jgi:hypothetical protein